MNAGTAVRTAAVVILSAGLMVLPVWPAAAQEEPDWCVDTGVAEPDETVSDGGSTGSDGEVGTVDGGFAGDCVGGGGGDGGVPDYSGSPEAETGGDVETTSGADDSGAGDESAERGEVAGTAEEDCLAGGGGTGAGITAPDSPRPDSETADVDTSAAESFDGLPGVAAYATTQQVAAIGAVPCVIPLGGVGAIGGGIVTPTRIDAGAGATAAAGSPAGAVFAGSVVLASLVEGIRRRRRS